MKHILTTILAAVLSAAASAASHSITSPSGRLTMSVEVDGQVCWQMSVDGVTISEGNHIALTFQDGRVLGTNPGRVKVTRRSVSETVPVLFYRCASMKDEYNSMTLKFKDWALECRAYDQGVAYRIVTSGKQSGKVTGETVEFRTAGHKPEGGVIPVKSSREYPYESSFECEYSFLDASQLDTLSGLDPSVPNGRHSYLPLLIDEGAQGRILLMETDVLNYPGIFATHDADGFKATFAPLMTDYALSRRHNRRRLASADYIAEVPGAFSFPWRIAAWAEQDKDLPTIDLTYLMASPCRIEDTSWIRPGITTWDWWNGFMLTGVDFKCGINTDFYKYHIDFAAANGLQYILIDEGWYKVPDMLTTIPEVDMEELCSYAASRGIRIWLWGTAHLVREIGMEKVFDKYAAMGIAGFKLDFIDGQCQDDVKMLTDIAECAARHQLMLDYHGVYKPCGLTRTYPNVLNFEGVFGLEQRANDMMLNDVTVPFIRQAAGPHDYTPGAMLNAGRIDRDHTRRGQLAQGTRAHQVALYTIFDSPFEMMCDSPSRYIADMATTSFITSIPTTFDESFVQSGKVGEYIVTVRRNGDTWYAAGITNWTARDLCLDLSFLPAGTWKAECFLDGINADKWGMDYKRENLEVRSGSELKVHLAPGGGFSVKLTR